MELTRRSSLAAATATTAAVATSALGADKWGRDRDWTVLMDSYNGKKLNGPTASP